MIRNIGAIGLALGTKDKKRALSHIYGFGADTSVGMKLSFFRRDQESKADRIGILYAARAGYDPREAIHFWEKMAGYRGGRKYSQIPLNTPRLFKANSGFRNVHARSSRGLLES